MELYGGEYPLIRRHGGKFAMYKKVVDAFPDDYESMTYAEPFVGGGSVFFNKEPSKKEIINDFDDDLVRLYRTVKKSPEELNRRINGSYTRKDFNKLKQLHPTSDIGKVVKQYLLSFLSFLGTGSLFEPRSGGVRKVERDFRPYSDRLSSVVIHNEDYKKVIHEYDSPNTFFYLDPPYEDTGKTLTQYSDIDFDEMADILSSIKGRFLMSVNNSRRIRDLFGRFNIKKATTQYKLKKRTITELLISNYWTRSTGE